MEGETIAAGRCLSGSCGARIGNKSVMLLNSGKPIRSLHSKVPLTEFSEGISVDEYQLGDEEADESDSIIDATVTEETVLLRLKSGKARLLHLVQVEDGTRFDVEEVEAKPVSSIVLCASSVLKSCRIDNGAQRSLSAVHRNHLRPGLGAKHRGLWQKHRNGLSWPTRVEISRYVSGNVAATLPNL